LELCPECRAMDLGEALLGPTVAKKAAYQDAV